MYIFPEKSHKNLEKSQTVHGSVNFLIFPYLLTIAFLPSIFYTARLTLHGAIRQTTYNRITKKGFRSHDLTSKALILCPFRRYFVTVKAGSCWTHMGQ